MVRMRKPEAPLFENVPPDIYVLEIRWLSKWRRPEPDEATEKALLPTEDEEKAVCIGLGALPLEFEIKKLVEAGKLSRESRVSRITSPLIQTSFFNPETGNWLKPWRDWIRPILGLPAGQRASKFIEDELEFPLDWLLGMRFRAEVFQEPRLMGGFWSRFRNPAPAEAWEERNLELLEERIGNFYETKRVPKVKEEFVSKAVAAALRSWVEALLSSGELSRPELNQLLAEVTGDFEDLKRRARRREVPLAEALYESEADLLYEKLKNLKSEENFS